MFVFYFTYSIPVRLQPNDQSRLVIFSFMAIQYLKRKDKILVVMKKI